MNTCGIITSHNAIAGYSSYPKLLCECARPHNHLGEHAVVGRSGRLWAFWTDVTCDCPSCQSLDPSDWCELVVEITSDEMTWLCASSQLVIYDV
jgi:hypothetical protein